jgi:TM2 domain
MKKSLFLSLTIIALSFQLSASVQVTNPTVDANTYYIGYGVNVTYQQLISLNPKEYKKLTGHKLGMLKSILLKKIQKKINKAGEAEGSKSQLVALLLVIFVGGLGVHRFYLGYTWQGVVQLLTLGGFGIWWLIDLIRIAIGDLKPKNGEYGKKL